MTPFFKTHLKLKLAPLLRAHGFKGSGVTFRRVSGPIIQVIHLQGSRSGDSCCVEIGTHLTFVPTVWQDVDPKRIAVHACDFRRRLAPLDAEDHWWCYGSTEGDAASSVAHLVATYETVGVRRLDQHRTFPGPFGIITPSALKNGDLTALPGPSTIPHAALVMARISVHLNSNVRARDFVRVGLDDLGSGPEIGIRRELLEIERSLGVAG